MASLQELSKFLETHKDIEKPEMTIDFCGEISCRWKLSEDEDGICCYWDSGKIEDIYFYIKKGADKWVLQK